MVEQCFPDNSFTWLLLLLALVFVLLRFAGTSFALALCVVSF